MGLKYIEIAHFYSDEVATKEKLSYLKNFKFDNRDFLSVFIDDYSVNSDILDRIALSDLIFQEVGKIVEHASEKQMADDYAEKTIEYLTSKYLVESRGDILVANNKVIKRGDKYSCFLLSLTWCLYRSGFFHNQYNEVLTIISKKYQKLEEKVKDFLPDDRKKLCEWIFV
jgi:hypothetical protein